MIADFFSQLTASLEAILQGQMTAWQATLLFGLLWWCLETGGGALRRWLVSCPSRFLRALARPSTWSYGNRLLEAATSILWLYFFSSRGIYAKHHTGLQGIDATALWPWFPQLLIGFSIWVGLLWSVWLRKRGNQGAERISFGEELLWLLTAEAQLAILRAGAIPLFGPYWGSLLSAGIKFIGQTTQLAQHDRRLESEQRTWRHFIWASDWISAALYLLVESLWPLLVLRGALYLALIVTRAATKRRGSKRSPTVSTPEEAARPSSPAQ